MSIGLPLVTLQDVLFTVLPTKLVLGCAVLQWLAFGTLKGKVVF